MLAAGGALNGKRYLKPQSVALMTRNHVGTLYTGTNSGANGKPGFGFGLSVATVEDNAASGLAVPNGSFGWNGAGGTKFWVSPAKHKRILVMYAPNGEAQGRIEKAVDDALKD